MVKKKGQAAMEFLMTYGWAILVVLAAIGALAYFGVLSPRNILPSSCTVGAGFGCKDTKATATTLQMTVLNNLGADLEEVTIEFTGDVVDKECVIDFSDAAWGDWQASGVGPPALGASGTCDDTDGCSIAYDTAAVGGPFPPLRTGKAFPAILFNSCDGPAGGESFSGNAVTDFTITYRASGETLTHQVNGKANLKVEV